MAEQSLEEREADLKPRATTLDLIEGEIVVITHEPLAGKFARVLRPPVPGSGPHHLIPVEFLDESQRHWFRKAHLRPATAKEVKKWKHERAVL